MSTINALNLYNIFYFKKNNIDILNHLFGVAPQPLTKNAVDVMLIYKFTFFHFSLQETHSNYESIVRFCMRRTN